MLTLVVGGAASGKSAYAERLVLQTALPRYYLATMQVWDAECAARVEKHRRMRAEKQFETLECPLHLGTVHLPARGTALLEDLGNLTANELYDPAGAGEDAAPARLDGMADHPFPPPRGGAKPPLRPFWTVWTDWPCNVNTSSSFRTKCSAAGQTTRATPTGT